MTNARPDTSRHVDERCETEVRRRRANQDGNRIAGRDGKVLHPYRIIQRVERRRPPLMPRVEAQIAAPVEETTGVEVRRYTSLQQLIGPPTIQSDPESDIQVLVCRMHLQHIGNHPLREDPCRRLRVVAEHSASPEMRAIVVGWMGGGVIVRRTSPSRRAIREVWCRPGGAADPSGIDRELSLNVGDRAREQPLPQPRELGSFSASGRRGRPWRSSNLWDAVCGSNPGGVER